MLKELAEASAKYSEKVNFHIVGNILDGKYFEAQIKPILNIEEMYTFTVSEDTIRILLPMLMCLYSCQIRKGFQEC